MIERPTPYSKMKKPDLENLLKSRNLLAEGSKTNMVSRLYRDDAERESEQKASIARASAEAGWNERQQTASIQPTAPSGGYRQSQDLYSGIIYDSSGSPLVRDTALFNDADHGLITMTQSNWTAVEEKKRLKVRPTSTQRTRLSEGVKGTRTVSNKKKKSVHWNRK